MRDLPKKIESQVRLPVTPDMDRETLERQYYQLQEELADTRDMLAEAKRLVMWGRDLIAEAKRDMDGASADILKLISDRNRWREQAIEGPPSTQADRENHD